ncbi:TetR/AcrR family transcriptional regulator [Microbispora sp. H10885]|uniref:TetR/AcrR family transcriptional regulator n=1 Tax=Microbispora sp. H10885 TaxID=2729110 RepID=UPI001C719431|nr:TetR/AcrR family transcriptional regulator [Microbispora sp. H10885]
MADHPSQLASAKELRADARHNRVRILDAARETFAARGLDAPMAAIARRAGVGVATLYRRFPSRESLITEVFRDELAACASVVDDALADPDPWRGFCGAIEKVCAMQVADRGFTDAFLTAFPDAIDYERTRLRAERGFAEMVRRAKATGRLRADFDVADLVLLLRANCGLIAGAGEGVEAASRRLVAYLLQSFGAGNAEPLPPPPPLTLGHMIQTLNTRR